MKSNSNKVYPVPADKEKNDDINDKPATFFDKLRHAARNISVEPVFAGLIIASRLSKIAVQNLNLDKACRVKLQFGDDICDSLIKGDANLTDYEQESQRVISAIETWRSIIQTAIPTILVIFMGAWSDRTGNRKFPILLPIFGEFLVCICNIISTFFFYEIDVEITMFLEVIFPAVTGGWVLVYLGVYSYIIDITSEEDRTFRMGIANVCQTAGVPIGTALSGVLLRSIGYYGIFLISGAIYFLTFLYGWLKLKKITKPEIIGENSKVKWSDGMSMVKETLSVAFKKRTSNIRTQMLVVLFVVAIVHGSSNGENIIIYLYVRYKLAWDAVTYSLYSTLTVVAHTIGATLSIMLFVKVWGFHDSLLCLISLTSRLAGSVLTAFAKTSLHMFMVPLVDLLNASTLTSLRSLISKLVEGEEVGKTNSLFSLVETISELILDPTYSAMYYSTLPIWPGAVFMFSIILMIPAFIAMTWFFIKHRRSLKC